MGHRPERPASSGQGVQRSGGFNLFKLVTDGTSGAEPSSNAVTWSARINGTFNLSKHTALQGSYFYRAPTKIEGGEFSSWCANFSVRQKIMGGKATVSLSVPIRSTPLRMEDGDDNIIQLTERKFNARAAHLTFQYNFGQAPESGSRRLSRNSRRAGFPG